MVGAGGWWGRVGGGGGWVGSQKWAIASGRTQAAVLFLQ